MFTTAFNHFFKQLAAHNDRDWFNEHKKEYETAVKKPFEQFIEKLIAAVASFDAALSKLQPKDAIFRLHRDTRFSNDKTPYKLHASAVISPNGRKDLESPGFYIQLGVGEIWLGGGSYMPSKPQIENIRTALINNADTVQQLNADADFVRLFNEIKGERNKRLLKPFSEWLEKLPLVANKQFYYMAEYIDDESLILRPDFLDFAVEHYRAAKPWQDFLGKAIK